MFDQQEVFGSNIRKLRKKLGFTQAQLAEAVGVDPLSIQSYETSRRFPKIEIMGKIAEVCNVEVADLFLNSEKPPLTLKEKTPMEELIELIQKKTAGIPDDVINLAMNYTKDDKDVWDIVRGALEHGLKSKDRKKAKRKA